MELIAIFSCFLLFAQGAEFQSSGEDSKECEYQHDIRTYFCKDIVDTFPQKFYGNYHLNCVHCNIRVFSNQTFPYSNSLVSFNVSNSNIRFIKSGAFSGFRSVQYIYLQNNEILEIEQGAFAGLRNVFELHLEHNHIVNVFQGFLENFEANSIDLSHNKIRELPARGLEGAYSTLILDLSWNQIRKLHADSFYSLDNLEVLNLSNNKICHITLGLFRYIKNLRHLDLSDNKLAKLAYGSFSGLRHLQTLELANNTVENVDGSYLLPLTHLTKLDLSGNGIYFIDVSTLTLNLPTLRFLRLDDNLLSCTVLSNMIQFLRKANVEVVNTVERYEVQNINGIACTELSIKQSGAKLADFLQVAKEETKKYVNYC